MNKKKERLVKVLKTIFLIVLLLGIVGFIAYYFENQYQNNVYLPIYECKNSTSKETYISFELNGYASIDNCTLKSNYKCEYDECYTSGGSIIYDNNKNDDGGYYYINSKTLKAEIGPNKRIEYHPNSISLIVQDKDTEKYALYERYDPKKNYFITDYIYDEIPEVKTGAFIVVANYAGDELKYGAIDRYGKKVLDIIYDEIKDSSSKSYAVVTKDNKQNLVSNNKFVFDEWVRYADYFGTPLEKKNYVIYINNDMLHFASSELSQQNIYTISDIISPISINIADDEEIYSNSSLDEKEENIEELFIVFEEKTYTLNLISKKIEITKTDEFLR